MTTSWCVIDSPVGKLLLVDNDGQLDRVHFDADEASSALPGEQRRGSPLLRETKKQLAAYFDGRLKRFELPLAPMGTPFQQRVWQALCEIPYGETISYAELARMVESPRGFRAVGSANGSNPIALIIPCHRVIATGGGLGGYAGGLDRKRWLLALEGSLAPTPTQFEVAGLES